jgi:hypothetical protein
VKTAIRLMVNTICLLLSMGVASAQTTRFLDCTSVNGSGDGTTPEMPWTSLDQANSYSFQPGDILLLKRGTTCSGSLTPRGSGTEGHPIKIGAYGVGALPAIAGKGTEAGIKLEDQQQWEISDIEVFGSQPYGIWITGEAPSLSHFRLKDVVVHDVPGIPKSKLTGLIVVSPKHELGTLINDVVIDGATAYATTQWAGIVVSAGSFNKQAGPRRGTDVSIRNSVVHNVAGDGILLMLAKNGLLEHNAAWNTGMQYTESIGTPDGIWEWMCDSCVVQYNEGFFTDSPGVDGGVFDIDWGNLKNVVQYNFGHDSQGYCVSIFGAEGVIGTSHDSVVRGNVCIANGRSPREAERQGAIYMSTWNRGKLDGFEIYGNTVYWDPPVPSAAIVSDADLVTGSKAIVRNNLVISRTGQLVRSTSGVHFLNNHYWVVANMEPQWQFDRKPLVGILAVQKLGEEDHSLLMDPRVDSSFRPTRVAVCASEPLLERDYFGKPMDACVGAIAAAHRQNTKSVLKPSELTAPKSGTPYAASGWKLVAVLAPEGDQLDDQSRSNMVVVTSMKEQFGPLRLHVAIVPNGSISSSYGYSWGGVWNFSDLTLFAAAWNVNVPRGR